MLNHDSDDERPSKRSRGADDDFPKFILPSERGVPRPAHLPPYTPFNVPSSPRPATPVTESQWVVHNRRQKDVAAIIAAAAQAVEEAKEAARREELQQEAALPQPQSGSGNKDPSQKPRKKPSNSSSKAKKPSMTKEEKEANKEKRLLKLIGAVVVKCMSKYKDQMNSEQFKKYAKEVRRLSSFNTSVRRLTFPPPANPSHCGKGEEVDKLQGRQT